MSSHDLYLRCIEIYLMLDDGDHRVLQPFGLTPAHYAALSLLDEHKGQRLIDLVEPLLLDKSSITRMLSRLEQQGLVVRTPDPHDGRAQRVTLTAAGAMLRQRAHIAFDRAIAERFAGLSDTQRLQLAELLDALHSHLRATLDTPRNTDSL
ncbi:MAG TPA: MarR family transcriptional regulator [Roseiflexaceae bacterium]|nr:MarR family transcriptional regulator [Roseiflexaceae bacterium]HMP43092.1 MarR family transcriptional regulator [Roseiflexaceae bacterium]